ncbi:MAG: autotransporter domain-containing protein [Candidatus Omnitrophota bacterium]
MRKLAVVLAVIGYVFSFSHIVFAAQESIVADHQAYGTNGDPLNEGAVFTGDFNYDVGDGDNLGQTGTVSIDGGEASFPDTGTVNFVGGSVLQGSIGENIDIIKAINCNGIAGKTVQVGAAAGADSFITAVTIAGAGTLNLDGSLFADTLAYTADGLVTIADNEDIFADITTATGGTGALTIEGTSTITGDVGASGAELKKINAGNNGEVVAFTGNIYTANLALVGTSTVTIAAGKNINNIVTAGTNGQGALTYLGSSTTGGNIGNAAGNALAAVNINGGTLSLGHNITATTATANNNAVCSLTGNRTITGDMTLAGTSTLNVGINTLTLAGTGIYTQGANTTLAVGVAGSTSGQIVGAGNAVVNANSAVDIATNGAYIPNGTTYRVVDGAGGAGVNVPATITDNDAFVSFSANSSSGDLILTANRTNSFDKIAANDNAAAVGAALDSAGKAGAVGDMLTVLNTLESLPVSDVSSSLDTFVPTVDAGAINATTVMNSNFVNFSVERAESAMRIARESADKAESGFSAGDKENLNGIWVKGFGSYITQDKRKGIKGYNSTTFGTILGVDRSFMNSARLGISGGWAAGDVNSDANNGKTDIDGGQATVYGAYDNEGAPFFCNCRRLIRLEQV